MSSNTDAAVAHPAPSEAKSDKEVEQATLREPTSQPQEENQDSTAPSQETSNESASEKGKSTYTGLAASAASTATIAAIGVKDNVFSMFGGGAKKEKRKNPGMTLRKHPDLQRLRRMQKLIPT